MATLGQPDSSFLGTNAHLHTFTGEEPAELYSAPPEQHQALLALKTRVYQKCAEALGGQVGDHFTVLDFSLEVLQKIDKAPNMDVVNAILLEESRKALGALIHDKTN